MNDFERGIEDWFTLPRANRTWIQFKTHFERAYQSLKNVRGPTMRNTSFQQQANAISEQVMREITQDRTKVINEVKTVVEDRILHAFAQTNIPDSVDPANPSINSTITDTVQLEILKLLKDLRQDFNNSKNNQRGKNPNNTTKKTRKKRPRTDVSKYCWTHGAWNHDSADCKFKAEGHQDKATFKNMMGGCTDYCQVCT